jgi:hypothetical protein
VRSSLSGEPWVRRALKILFMRQSGQIRRTLALSGWYGTIVLKLPAPPRSLTQTEISRFSANSPELAGIRAGIQSLQAIGRTSGVVSAPLSLPRKIAFPDSRNGSWQRLGSNAGSVRGRMEHFTFSAAVRPPGCVLIAIEVAASQYVIGSGRYDSHAFGTALLSTGLSPHDIINPISRVCGRLPSLGETSQ